MVEHILLEQAKLFLDGELTFKQLHECMDEAVLHDFRFGESDPDTTRLADNLVGMFAEYQLECELLGNPSEAMETFRKSLLEFIQLNTIEYSPRRVKLPRTQLRQHSTRYPKDVYGALHRISAALSSSRLPDGYKDKGDRQISLRIHRRYLPKQRNDAYRANKKIKIA